MKTFKQVYFVKVNFQYANFNKNKQKKFDQIKDRLFYKYIEIKQNGFEIPETIY